MVTPVSVNPSSSTDALSGATSGVGGTTFYLGGNPNLALLTGAGSNTMLWIVGGVVLAVGGLLLLRRRR